MAQKTWDNEITKTQDWGGDATTNNLQVSGNRVQEFIKNSLENKMGAIYYDTTNNRYLSFADVANRDLWIADPINNANLVLGTWDAPAAYTMTYKLLTETTVYILNGKNGNYIRFTFDTINKNNQPIGEAVSVTYNFTNGNTKKSIKKEYAAGTMVEFLLDNHIGVGTNRIQVVITGLTTFISTSFLITYDVVQLDLATSYDMATVNKTNILVIPYTLTGAGAKTTEFYIDGNKVTALGEDTATTTSVSKSRIIDLSSFNLEDGIHNLQIRSYVVNNSQTFYSNTLYRSFIIDKNENLIDNYVGVGTDLPSGSLIATGSNLEIIVTQFEQFSISYFGYSSGAVTTIPITVKLGNLTIASINATNNTVNTWNYISRNYGTDTLHFITSNQDLPINLDIVQSVTGLTEVTSGLAVKLTAVGRSNNDTNKNSWTYGNYSTIFNDFQWTKQSGWDGTSLVMSNGSNIEVNVKPFNSDIKATGMAIEVDFMATNVIDDNAVIFSCVNPDTNVGCVITGQMISMTSPSGTTCKMMYAAEERNHVIFMITKTSETYHNLMMIFINGIMSASAVYQNTESFTGQQTVKVGNAAGNAGIKLYNLKTFTSNFSDDEAVNEYIVSKEDSSELLELYNKNNIYDENGNVNIDKISAICPVMKVTGDLDTLMATSDKNIKVNVDIDYINLQDPKKSFTTKGSEIKLQGTSTLGYPRKNWKMDFGKGTLYDYDGKVVVGGLYQLYDINAAQKKFTIKADYMDSSMSRNSSIARLWNDAMYNAQINGEYKLRTAPQVYQENNADTYPYKVRTTPNSLPIVMFYRETESDDWTFLGQYNFLNDKGNDTLYGFKGVTGFDNSDAVCFEGLENTTLMSKFRDVSNFDSDWNVTWEFRYPDFGDGSDATTPKEIADRDKRLSELKDMVTWINSTNRSSDVVYGSTIVINAEIETDSNGTIQDNDANRLLKFKKEKWDHFDVYKVAAYYVYLMRFGAVDQVVKNTFFTSFGKGTQGTKYKWFFINYDNDTIVDKINDGHLIYDYLFDRSTTSLTTQDGENYNYMGHDSVLWNNLEADDEFMDIVRIVDNAIYSGGMTYKSVINMFDVKQRNIWPERVFNSNQIYKYLEPYYNNGTNNLFMLNGSMESHDHWWLSRRYNRYDSLYVSGNYKGKNIEFKVTSGQKSFSITSGQNGVLFGYGINNDPIETVVSIPYGESHIFNLPRALAIGDPVRIYSAQNVESVNLSPYIETLTYLSLGGAYDAESDTTNLSEVILSDGIKTNAMLESISGLDSLSKLTKLDIRNYTKLTSISLVNNKTLTTLLASGSGIGSVDLPNGSPIATLSLPSMKILLLSDLPNLTMSGLTLDDNGVALNHIEINNCAGLGGSSMQSFITSWMANKTTASASCILKLDNINWTSFDPAMLISMGSIGTLSLKGKIVLSSITQSQYNQITNLFGVNVWNLNNSLSINAASGAFIGGPSSVNWKSTGRFSATIFPLSSSQVTTWSVLKSSEESVAGISIDSTGLLTTTADLSNDVQMVVKAVSGSTNVSMNVLCYGPVYPTSDSYLTTPKSISTTGDVSIPLNIVPANANGAYTVDWIITGTPVTDGYVTIKSQNDSGIVLNVNTIYQDTDTHEINITATINRTDGNIYAIKTVAVITTNSFLFTKYDNAEVVAKMFAANKCASSYGMTKAECEAVTSLGTIFKGDANLKSFNELQYFTGLTSLGDYCFQSCTKLASIALPTSIKSLGWYCFDSCSALASITLSNNITSLGSYCFQNCTSLTSATLPNSITGLPNYCFNGCKSLINVQGTSNFTAINAHCFEGCSKLVSINVKNNVQLGAGCFAYCNALESFNSDNSFYAGSGDGGPGILRSTNIKSAIVKKVIYDDNSFYSSLSGCFSECRNLISVIISEGIKYASMYCFNGCTSLTSITLPNSITNIGEGCFNNCTSLTSITLPNSITSIGSTCFYGCKVLISISCLAASAPTTTNSSFGTSSSTYTGSASTDTKYLYVPSNATGYEGTTGTGWAALLDTTKCNFKISKTL